MSSAPLLLRGGDLVGAHHLPEQQKAGEQREATTARDGALLVKRSSSSSVNKKCPRWFTPIWLSKPSTVFRCGVFMIPALLIKMSIGRSRSRMSSAARLASDRSERSAMTDRGSGAPARRIWSVSAAAFSAFHLGDPTSGLGQGFDRYDASSVGDHRAITSAQVTDHTIEALDRLRGERFFLFAHYFDPHYPYLSEDHPDPASRAARRCRCGRGSSSSPPAPPARARRRAARVARPRFVYI